MSQPTNPDEVPGAPLGGFNSWFAPGKVPLKSCLKSILTGQNLLAILATLVFTALLLPSIPRVMRAELDPSWEGAIDWLARHDQPLGGDVFFPYGPFGHLYRTTNYGQPLTQWYMVSALVSLSGAFILVRSMRGKGPLFTCITFASAILASLYGRELIPLLLVLAIADRLGRPISVTWLILLGLSLATLALMKFTYTVAVVSTTAIVVAGLAARKLYQQAAKVLLSTAFMFVALWILAGNHLGSIPAWLTTSIELTTGYQTAMSTEESGAIFGFALAITILSFLLPSLFLLKNPGKIDVKSLTPVLLLSPLLYIAWKHGISRAPGHSSILFGGMGSLAFSAVWRLRPDRYVMSPRMPAVVASAILCFSVAGIWTLDPNISQKLASPLEKQFANVAGWLGGSSTIHDQRQAELIAQRHVHQLPRVRHMVSTRTVDVFGHEQAVAIYNDFFYSPRPVFQSYSVYTPSLIHQNAEYFRSPRRPAFVLLKLQSIDGHVPTLADGEAFREILYHYRPCALEGGFILFKEFDGASPQPSESRTGSGVIGTPIRIQSPEGTWQRLKIHLSPTLWGKVRSFFYKPNPVGIEIHFEDGRSEPYRLNPTAAKAGFLTEPWFTGTPDVTQYFIDPKSISRVKEFNIPSGDPALRRNWRSTIEFEIDTFVPPAGLTAQEREILSKDRIRELSDDHFMINLPPSRTQLAQVRATKWGDLNGLIVLPTDWLQFAVPASATSLSGFWGLLPSSYTPPQKSDGMTITVLASSSEEGPWEAIWSSQALPGQTGSASPFEVPLAKPSPGWVRLHLGPGPSGQADYDWGFLSDLEWQEK